LFISGSVCHERLLLSLHELMLVFQRCRQEEKWIQLPRDLRPSMQGD